MSKKSFPPIFLHLDKIVAGGQALGTMDDGRKVFVWGGLPGEDVTVQLTKRKSTYAEGDVTELHTQNPERTTPIDPESYLSTSPWQIMSKGLEQKCKESLIKDAFALHHCSLPGDIKLYTDHVRTQYRNKIEYSFWFDTTSEKLSLAFFRRGAHGKIAIDSTSLASSVISLVANHVLGALNTHNIGGRELKTLLIRSSQTGDYAWQLYVKDQNRDWHKILEGMPEKIAVRGEIIFSHPKSPASVITKRLTPSVRPLEDTILGIPFRYATEGFFQINLPVYEQSLRDMREWMPLDTPVVDLYSGVGSIGLTIGGDHVTLVEQNEHAVREMRRNIADLGRTQARAVHAASENVLDAITSDATIIVDPPRAGLHESVVLRLLDVQPARIVYLSCNPVTQARDVAKLLDVYEISAHRGYNFFPMTPHIEHLVVLTRK